MPPIPGFGIGKNGQDPRIAIAIYDASKTITGIAH